jgi:hypothetical protein
MSVPDNARVSDLEDEPKGLWRPVHAQVAVWAERYAEGQEDDGDVD